MICKKCNEFIEERVKFCPKCGTPIEEISNNQNSLVDTIKEHMNDGKDETNMYNIKDINDNKVIGGLAYFLFFLPLIASPNSKYGRFHANQGLILLITVILFGVIDAILTNVIVAVSWRLWFVASFINFVVWIPLFIIGIIGLINGFTGKAKSLPIIGKYKIIK